MCSTSLCTEQRTTRIARIVERHYNYITYIKAKQIWASSYIDCYLSTHSSDHCVTRAYLCYRYVNLVYRLFFLYFFFGCGSYLLPIGVPVVMVGLEQRVFIRWCAYVPFSLSSLRLHQQTQPQAPLLFFSQPATTTTTTSPLFTMRGAYGWRGQSQAQRPPSASPVLRCASLLIPKNPNICSIPL
jgi:hypothetical protein